jgi:hypothetical protein
MLFSPVCFGLYGVIGGLQKYLCITTMILLILTAVFGQQTCK